MNRLQRKLFWVKTGAKVYDRTDEDSVEYIIRFKDIYISVIEGQDSGDYSVGWMRTPMTHTPVRDFWRAYPPNKRIPARFKDETKKSRPSYE